MPYLFPTPAMTAGLPARPAVAVHADAGRFAYDTMTLVGPGTWEAARAAVDCAVAGRRARRPTAPRWPTRCAARPATTRPRPGFGGSCYLNNAAVAAAALRAAGAASGSGIVDVDAHQGNGTAAIFYDRADVALRLGARRPGRGLVPARRRVRRRDRRRRRRGCHPQPAAARGHRRRAVAGRGRRAGRLGARAATPSSSRSASTPPPTTRRARCRSPRTATARPAGCSARTGCRPSPSRRAATTCRPSAAWSRRTSRGTGSCPPRAEDADRTRGPSYPGGVKVLLLENIHPVAVETLEARGHEVELRTGSLSEDELVAALPGVHAARHPLEHPPHRAGPGRGDRPARRSAASASAPTRSTWSRPPSAGSRSSTRRTPTPAASSSW